METPHPRPVAMPSAAHAPCSGPDRSRPGSAAAPPGVPGLSSRTALTPDRSDRPGPGLDAGPAPVREAPALEQELRAAIERGYAQACRLLPPTDAEDAVQEAVVLLLRQPASASTDVPFAARWARLVHVACRRIQVGRARRRRREHVAATDWAHARAAAGPGVEPETRDVAVAALRAAVAQLGERDQRAVSLHYGAGLSQRDCAQLEGISENALALRLSRARSRLRRLLARDGVTADEATLLGALTASGPAVPPHLVHHLAQACAHWGAAGGAGSVGLAASLPAPGGRAGAHPRALRFSGAVAAVGVVVVALLLLARAGGGAPGAHPAVPLVPRTGVEPLAAVPPPLPLPPPPARAQGPWADTEAACLGWSDPQAELALGVDLTYLRAHAPQLPPFTVLLDPEAQPLRALARSLLETPLADNDIIALIAAVVGDGRAAVISQPSRGQPAVLVDAAVAADALSHLFADLVPPAQRRVVGAFTFGGPGAVAIGCAPGRFVVCDPDRLASRLAALTPPARGSRPSAPVWLRADGPAAQERLAWLLPAPAPGTAGPALALTLASGPGPHGWSSQGTITGLRGWRAVDPTALGPLPPGTWLRAVAAVPPAVLAARLAGLPRVGQQIGSLLAPVLDACTGDVAITVDPAAGSPVPSVRIVLGVADMTRLAAMVPALIAQGGGDLAAAAPPTAGAGSGATGAGDTAAVPEAVVAMGTIPTPVGEVRVVRTARQLRLCLGPDVPGTPLVLPATTVLDLQVALPTLAPLLPVLLRGPVQAHPLLLSPALQERLDEVAQAALGQAEAQSQGDDGGPSLHLSERLSTEARALLAHGQMEVVSRHQLQADGQDLVTTAAVAHIAEGYVIAEERAEVGANGITLSFPDTPLVTPILARAAVLALLEGSHVVEGPALEALPVLPEARVWDAAVLPGPAAWARALPQEHASATLTPDGMAWQEEGLPLGAALLLDLPALIAHLDDQRLPLPQAKLPRQPSPGPPLRQF